MVTRNIHNKSKEIYFKKLMSILAYANDTMILRETEENIKLTTDEYKWKDNDL